jgi:hypothetical protein
VESKVLTEDEFWATRKKLLGKDSIRKSKQQLGLKSMMVSGIKPSTDGRVWYSYLNSFLAVSTANLVSIFMCLLL